MNSYSYDYNINKWPQWIDTENKEMEQDKVK